MPQPLRHLVQRHHHGDAIEARRLERGVGGVAMEILDAGILAARDGELSRAEVDADHLQVGDLPQHLPLGASGSAAQQKYTLSRLQPAPGGEGAPAGRLAAKWKKPIGDNWIVESVALTVDKLVKTAGVAGRA